jgi:hypothetical protein
VLLVSGCIAAERDAHSVAAAFTADGVNSGARLDLKDVAERYPIGEEGVQHSSNNCWSSVRVQKLFVTPGCAMGCQVEANDEVRPVTPGGIGVRDDLRGTHRHNDAPLTAWLPAWRLSRDRILHPARQR